MPEANGHNGNPAGANTGQLWRDWLTETERQWNGFFNEVLGTDSFARVVGSYTEGYALLQRALSRSMERYLNTFNLPTHADIIDLGERLHGIEERLSSLETSIHALAEAAGLAANMPVTRLRPRRTRQPRPQGQDVG
jgi:hypothetical protein